MYSRQLNLFMEIFIGLNLFLTTSLTRMVLTLLFPEYCSVHSREINTVNAPDLELKITIESRSEMLQV
jgi:hypothetical protein